MNEEKCSLCGIKIGPDGGYIWEREQMLVCEECNLEMSSHPERNYRPWGHYEVLGEGPNWKLKKLVVDPGKRTSLQWHEKRVENWEAVEGDRWSIETQWRMKKGPGKPTVTDTEQVWTHIDMREVHRIHNTGNHPLVIIELQRFDTDDPSGEEDVHRVEDDYGRSVE